MAGELVMIKDSMSETIIKTAKRIATLNGAKAVTVRNILRALNITNRVFYNTISKRCSLRYTETWHRRFGKAFFWTLIPIGIFLSRSQTS